MSTSPKTTNLINDAIYRALTEQPKRRIDNHLWVSDLGRNPYGPLRRLLTGELEPFDYSTLLKMDGGNALEAASLRQIAESLNRPIKTQVPLFNDIWSGYADLVIDHGTNNAIIYDHKGSAGKWWDYKESLPRTSDCLQVWLYGELYREMYGVQPRMGLYYRGWGTWAEFQIEVVDHHQFRHYVVAKGEVTNEKGVESRLVTRNRYVNPFWMREELEGYYDLIKTGSMTLEDVEAMKPDGPNWDYAENACLKRAGTQVDDLPF